MAALAAFVAAPLLAHAQAPADNNSKAVQEVIEFRNRYIEAEENRDMAYLDKILADDFFALNPQGQLLDKAQQLANLKRPDRTLKVLNPRETKVRFYGDVAILTEHVTVDGMDIRAVHLAENTDSSESSPNRTARGRSCWRKALRCPRNPQAQTNPVSFFHGRVEQHALRLL
jgi:hypothetical protein